MEYSVRSERYLIYTFFIFYHVSGTDAVLCYPYNDSNESGIVINAPTYICPDDTNCCRNGCCEKIYLAWYMWVFVVLAVIACCFVGYFIKRHKLLRKQRIGPGDGVSSNRLRTIDMISRGAIFTTQNSAMSTGNAVGIGGVTTFEHITHINVAGRTPPAYTTLDDEGIHQRPQQSTPDTRASSNTTSGQPNSNEAPPSYSSIWNNR